MAFGDIRVAERADWLIDRIAATGSVVLRRLGGDRAGEMVVHRFLSSPHVSTERIVATLSERTAQQCGGRRILAVQDTTEINFAGRGKRRRGLGPGGDGKTPGFFIHPVITIDVETEALVGLVDAAIWTRPAGRKGARRKRPLEDKESARWLAGCAAAAEQLGSAAAVTMVADRESDIYQLFARKPDGLELIVRAAQDRSLADGGRLFTALAEAPLLSISEVRVAPRGPGDKGRSARVELRAGTVTIARPSTIRKADAPPQIALTLVELRETAPPRRRCFGGCSPPIAPEMPPRQKPSSTSIACAGASNSSSVLSRATASPSTTARSTMPSVCSTSPPSAWPPPFAPSNWSMPETAASGRPAMSSIKASPRPSKSCRESSKARPSGKRTRIPPARSPSSPGSLPASVAGIATTSPPDQRPCE
jgi:hypothetical protein